ncbi:lyase family protein [Actinoplanes sp. NPDC049265]|uniref:lyase family protein n=1 Tax=Actinoplanes sp. NPDC049265 TaxID=3363902 RepID=UPI00371FF06F
MTRGHTNTAPLSLLLELAGDEDQLAVFSAAQVVESWLAAERALALAQAEQGILTRGDAEAIVGAARAESIDTASLWQTARVVGYPVLGLVRQVAAALPAGPEGRIHYGATTQDIMDTGLALQLNRSLAGLDRLLGAVGDTLADRVTEYADAIMAARTHAQQAVPTTFGATLGTLLAQFARHRQRLAEALPRVARVSLFGAGGTSAALGPKAGAIRAGMARILELHDSPVPWHVDRDTIAEYGWWCATVTGACAKFARNIIDLSRTEIAEAFEPFESHRGASSTMPQKVNPISSEIIVGAAATTSALTSALLRMQEAGHERAAGEWQLEWQIVPQLGVLAGTALRATLTVLTGLRVDRDRMRANLAQDSGLVMAEAHMIALASSLGRERAHDLVYEAAAKARTSGRTLAETLPEIGAAQSLDPALSGAVARTPQNYLGRARAIAEASVRLWHDTPAATADPKPLHELAVRGMSGRRVKGHTDFRTVLRRILHRAREPAEERIVRWLSCRVRR